MISAVTIVEKIRARQEEQNLNDTAFAKKLGISRVSWYYIRTGRNKPSQDFFSKVVRAFPELSRDILNTVTEQLFKGNGHTQP
jgi:DNA-binding XRE family transcriptional regulator